ncbi:MAG: Flp family type IVb pilin [Sneathiellales bacterium]|nr:Flp family type IVb pilin [Sneathiellales bacterium]
MLKMVRSFLKDESGATAIEYGLIAALVALVGVAAFTALGTTVTGSFDAIASELCDGAGGSYTATNVDTGEAGSCSFAADDG